jgi:hypothetical protein
MPKPTAADFPMHVWRINSNAAYSTFPTFAEFNGICSIGTLITKATCTPAGGNWTDPTNKNANAAADDKGYAKAVWVDLDLACGICHGGSSTTTHNGAMYFNKATLAAFAKSMHTGPQPAVLSAPTVSHSVPTQNSWSVTFTDKSTFDPAATMKNVSVNWGDGGAANVCQAGTGGSTGIPCVCLSNCNVETKAPLSTFTHTYSPLRVRSYSISQAVSDGVNPVSPTSRTAFKVNVPQRLTVSGIVTSSTGTAMSSARVYLKLNGHTRKVVTTSGSGAFSFTGVLPTALPADSYSIRVYKFGATFGDTTNVRLYSQVTRTIQATQT